MERGNRLRRLFVRAVIAVGIAASVVALFVYLGVYDIAATSQHLPPTQWLLATAADRSIAARADDIDSVPSAVRIDREHGFIHYHEMCVACHGAPGIEPSEVARGLNPTPPDFGSGSYERPAGEVFWIIKNGIRMTGMPGFGPTHTDEEIWSMVALLAELHEMEGSEYARRVSELGLAGSATAHGTAPSGGHVDAPGSAPHAH